MVRGFARQGQTAKAGAEEKGIAKGTLPFRGLGLTNVREEAGMGRAALCIVRSGFGKAELAVYGQAHLRGVRVLLAVVLPPTDRTQKNAPGASSVLYPQHGQRWQATTTSPLGFDEN
jgi:hypothetical protein